ncbi:hypothetical protein Glove_283g17 [Diversispora epigaea]|uniref:Uncharacterized protein n=1 Tax=Diversispora epigaea TaxID=1348612 RepID=A0A397I8Q0_9GLOM|nr:hypothetical protein Glove_283g17 [Diversispora epigaea]
MRKFLQNSKKKDNNRSIKWKSQEFPTLDKEQVQSWTPEQLVAHLYSIFNLQRNCQNDPFIKDLLRKFETTQIDGNKFLEMDRNDFLRIVKECQNPKGYIIGLLEGEMFRLNGRYCEDVYCDPVVDKKKRISFTQFHPSRIINSDKSFHCLLVRNLDIIPPSHDLRRYLASPLTLRIPIPSMYLHENLNPEIFCYLIAQEQCFNQSNCLMTAPTLSLPFLTALTFPCVNNSQDIVLLNYTLIIDALIQGTFNSFQQFEKFQWLYIARTTITITSCSTESPEDSLRPDWMCWINKLLLVFQGIQLSEDTDWQIGIYQLMSKIHWRSMYYANLPYTFAYISKGSKLRFYLYRPNFHQTFTPLIQISQEFDLDSIMDRLGIIKTTLNIYSIFKTIKRQWNHFTKMTTFPSSTINPLYLSIQRNGEITIEYLGEFVRKTVSKNFMDLYFDYKVLCEIYQDTRFIKNLVHCVDNDFNYSIPIMKQDGGCKILIHPVGYNYYPRNENELKNCFKTILEVLRDMHNVGWTHRDIHWGNIMRQEDNNKAGEWLLIDLELGRRVNDILDITLWNRWPKEAEKGKIYKANYDVWQIWRIIQERGDDIKGYSKKFWRFQEMIGRAVKDNINAEVALKHEWFDE